MGSSEKSKYIPPGILVKLKLSSNRYRRTTLFCCVCECQDIFGVSTLYPENGIILTGDCLEYNHRINLVRRSSCMRYLITLSFLLSVILIFGGNVFSQDYSECNAFNPDNLTGPCQRLMTPTASVKIWFGEKIKVNSSKVINTDNGSLYIISGDKYIRWQGKLQCTRYCIMTGAGSLFYSSGAKAEVEFVGDAGLSGVIHCIDGKSVKINNSNDLFYADARCTGMSWIY